MIDDRSPNVQRESPDSVPMTVYEMIEGLPYEGEAGRGLLFRTNRGEIPANIFQTILVPACNSAMRWATGIPHPGCWPPGWPQCSWSSGVSGMEKLEPSLLTRIGQITGIFAPLPGRTPPPAAPALAAIRREDTGSAGGMAHDVIST